jgi:hypothetical protein
MRLNDMACYKETLQVKKTCRVGWLLGSLPRAFNTKEFEEGLATMEELHKFQLEIRVEPIKTKIGSVPAIEFVKAAHIWTAYDKASQVRKALNSVFGSTLRQNLPLVKKLRFVPYSLDKRFINSNKQRFNIKK